ncbi:hypothetical protein Zmor_007285 [Zophobas morio]|uniref:Mismatch repair endonuclease PMS2 n=1 Tax=Zophobas morio TaxID=2755281 RepID=A0AA38IX19_9CUCU|nr:hypothetical protein Zmor_007285 [Zophobas morio]
MDCDNEENIVASSQPKSDIIQPINRDTVHRICSGQVVLSLAIAVKELVENAIDAGATIIDIQLKEYGSELIEVCDNGSGVEKENFQALTLKHYTSKIRQFNDLANLSTLGFRGEALSSLCALSDLSILTKHTSATNATKITYDRNGKIISEVLGAREQGTTVTLENLFSTLPVRRKEFVKNLKREFNKMCQLLYAYCLVSKGVKFSCTNTTSKGSKNTVASTDGLNTVRDNIINVFGAKQISSLIEVEIIEPDESFLNEYGIKSLEKNSLPFDFDFFISSVIHGSGRSTSDRQFFYINSRPCEPTKLTKLINEVYKQYNHSQYPFIYLNILTKSCLVDVNVTPDKRQVFLEKEKLLLAAIKASLIEAFKNFPSSYKMQNLDLTQNTSVKDFLETKTNARGLKRSSTDGELKKGSILQKFKKRSKTENDKDELSPQTSFCLKEIAEESEKNNDTVMLDTFIKLAHEACKNEPNTSVSPSTEETNAKKICKSELSTPVGSEANSSVAKISGESQTESKDDKIEEIEFKIVCDEGKKAVENVVALKTHEIDKKIEKKESTKTGEKIEEMDSKENGTNDSQDDSTIVDKSKKEIKDCKDNTSDKDVDFVLDSTFRDRSFSKSVTLHTTLKDIKEALKKRNICKENDDIKVRFRSKINPESNKTAEEELRKQISKEDFAKMEIIGQFNLGFIIARLYNDLFIIDQHATDEKYNFEDLQANTVMENQVLVNPRPLQLTAANESLLIENEDIFKKNGFTFKIDESAPCTKKVQLTSVPLSKSIVFGKDDIDEMLFMLQDSNHTMCRPSRIRAMFASRACRKSVMIGKSLSNSDMRKLIDHMGEIEQPWNCPHGRPTMRHLINLDLIDTNET